MSTLKRTIFPVLLATIWISLSEFFRNQFLLKSHWEEHYIKLGLVFPTEPVNGAVWGLWSLLFACAVYILAKKYSLLQTALFAWFVGFVLMWVAIGNLGVLPPGLLLFAIPLSALECFVASFIIKKLSQP